MYLGTKIYYTITSKMSAKTIVKRVSLAFLVTLLSILWLIRFIKRKLNVMKITQKEHSFYQENIQSRFEQTCRDCCLTSQSLTLTLDKKIRESSFVIEEITASLQELSRLKVLSSEQKMMKIDLWNQLKIIGTVVACSSVA